MKNLFILFAVITMAACTEPASDFKIIDPTPIKEIVTPAKEEIVTPTAKEELKTEPVKQTKPKATTPGALRKPLSEK